MKTVIAIVLSTLVPILSFAQGSNPAQPTPSGHPLIQVAPQSPITSAPNATPPFGLEESLDQTVNEVVTPGDAITVKLPGSGTGTGGDWTYVDKVSVTFKGKAKIGVYVNGNLKGTLSNDRALRKKTQIINVQAWTDGLLFLHQDGRRARILKLKLMARYESCSPYPFPQPGCGPDVNYPMPPIGNPSGDMYGNRLLNALNGLYATSFVLARSMTGTDGDNLFMEVRSKAKHAAEAGRAGGASSDHFVQLAKDALAAATVIQPEIDKLLGIAGTARAASAWVNYLAIIERAL